MITIPIAVVLAVVVGRLLARRYEGRLATVGAVAEWTPTAVVRVPVPWPTIRALGVGEVRRLFLHPLWVVGMTLAILATGLAPGDPHEAYFSLTGSGAAGLYLPTLTFLAATLIATRSRRARTRELLATTPAGDVDRTLGLAVTGVLAAAMVLVIVLAAYAAYRAFGVDLPRTPGLLELLPLPLTVLGAVTLGAMVGRWLPFRGVGPVVLFVLVVVTGILTGDVGPHSPYFATFVELIPYEGPATPVPIHLVAGHDLYLLGLDAMAVVGAVLHDRPTRRWWVLGFVAVVFTAAMGAWQIS